MTDTFRAMCAELVRRWDVANGDHDLIDVADAMNRARALLAQPVAEGPTDDELMDIARAADLVYYMGKGRGFGSPYQEGADIEAEVLAFARAALAHWGRHTPQPVATSERLDWLRPNALPTPEATNG